MQPISNSINHAQPLRVREAMRQFRAQRAQTVERIMTRIANRDPQRQDPPATDPTGARGRQVDVRA